MNEEQFKKMMNEAYDDTKEDSLRTMVKAFYSKKMRWVAINIWVWFFIFLAPMVYSATQFFKTDQTKLQIMYAAIFVCCFSAIGFLKVLGWVMLSRHLAGREIKRLELRIVELNEFVKNK